ncbi:MAG: 2OG-Fe(II) oxygenase [Kineosporiaceae bacterium]|nr:2OG-Fe(II) oxygenase [Aeromicrobium sp.]
MTRPNFMRAESWDFPFPHFRVSELLPEPTSDALLEWLDADAPWKLQVTDFYEQHEFSMFDCNVPSAVAHIVSNAFVADLAHELSERLDAPALELTEVAVHRLIAGQTIRIHNDDIGKDETHRLIVQLNRGWKVEQGGLFMIFEADDPESVTDVLLPVHRSAFGFEISKHSHHAVSTIYSGNRDTLVYTFRHAI